MTVAAPTGEVGRLAYDVRENDDRCHAATSVGSASTYVAHASILVAGIIAPIIAIYRGDWPLLPVGICFIIFGSWMLRLTRVKSERRLLVVKVSSEGMDLLFSDGINRTYSWKDPTLKLRLIDYSAGTERGPPGFRGFASIPCGIIVGTGPVGISLAALKGIRQSARGAGVPVVDGVPNSLRRAIYIGHWPDVSRPFPSINPYA